MYKRTQFIPSVNHFVFECPSCSSATKKVYLKQAPLLLYNKPIPQNRHPPKLLKSISGKKCKKCLEEGQQSWMGLYVKDKKRPMFSLTRICLKCSYEEPLVVLPYRPVQPSEQLTKGITVSIANGKKLEKLDFVELLNKDHVGGMYFSENISVNQVTFGYKLGQYMSSIPKAFTDEYFGRKIKTQGFVIKLKPEVYRAAKEYLKTLYIKDPQLYMNFEKDLVSDPEYEELQLKRWVLHTLQNSLLVVLPIFTGLPPSEFSGSYDLNEDKILIFDNQEGGIGGCMKFKENPEIFYDYFDTIITSITRCNCRHKCPKCIAMDNDGEVNQALNRHLIVPIFENIETTYD